jgi:heme exporter protein D
MADVGPIAHAAKVLRELHRKKEIEARISGAQHYPLQAKGLED